MIFLADLYFWGYLDKALFKCIILEVLELKYKYMGLTGRLSGDVPRSTSTTSKSAGALRAKMTL